MTVRLTALVCLIAVLAGCDRGTSPHVRLHPPSSARERAAGRVALEFALLLQSGDAERACDSARGLARRTLRCARKPAIPGWLRIPPGKRPAVVDVTPAEVPGAIRLGLHPGSPLLAIEVDRMGRVVYLSGYGYS
jgi:hypothetical protein